MVTVYGSGSEISCPKSVGAPPPVGQVIAMSDTGAVVTGAVDVTGAGVVDDGAEAVVASEFCACAVDPSRWPSSTLPTRAPASARAPIRTPFRWLRFRRTSLGGRARCAGGRGGSGGRRAPAFATGSGARG